MYIKKLLRLGVNNKQAMKILVDIESTINYEKRLMKEF